MPTVAEALAAPGALASALREGVNTISSNQTITFTKYVKLILPLDGFVFWVKADLVSASAQFNAAYFNGLRFDRSTGPTPTTFDDAKTIDVPGSLHYSSDSKQSEEENYTVNRVLFTSQAEIQQFNTIGSNVLWLATFKDIRFAFSSRGQTYEQAGLWHYVGDAVYADMESQLIDKLDGFDTRNVVVSNSLPWWLSLNTRQQIYPVAAWCPIQLYPAMLLPENIPPPFASVDVISHSTQAVQSLPFYGPTYSHSQLVMERVKITMYGLRNFNAMDLMDFVFQAIGVDGDPVGLSNMPVIRDEKRTQNELDTLAMKKSVEFEINYYQSRIRDTARQLILSCIPTFTPKDTF